ncbi:uncharacterized protein L969DRAFT_89284 [Mixia osmundae IAM 14324]|uniref:NAD(P)-binding protein n=1 Tax=Mixia osmundae (strain CBS 9802 / IAM 14324 / JCM 22182 / KY 12970) TaxID=764103 RepID=G7EAT5_MIXOS|nr:uncharacterized protein L969DRAFT_89284 [Mixia osmundae IAM 14324]KEI38029.1 hypothetical protein L969DRAFT_89284 [Mixia osmundae IAM 14324]GAA99945.1 hypothetical protein E5Q_06648 [Mixia osmundae IAM 14324]
MAAIAKATNATLNLSSKTAVVSGGTQGIGAATAIRFAQLGASVLIVGRSKERGEQVVSQCARANSKGSHGFVQADLSLVTGIRAAAQEIETRAGSAGVDFLVQTQGGPPNGRQSLTKEGNEFHFTVQCLSRFGLPYLLAKAGKLNSSVVCVGAPGSGVRDFDGDDIQRKKAGGNLIGSGNRDSVLLDVITEEGSNQYPSLAWFHVFPGFVLTDALSNQGFPMPIVQLAKLLRPILSRTVASTPEYFSDVPVYLAASEQAREGPRYLNNRLKELKLNPWVESPENRRIVWKQLQDLIGS